jgi:hypothetical protein
MGEMPNKFASERVLVEHVRSTMIKLGAEKQIAVMDPELPDNYLALLTWFLLKRGVKYADVPDYVQAANSAGATDPSAPSIGSTPPTQDDVQMMDDDSWLQNVLQGDHATNWKNATFLDPFNLFR